MPNKTSRPSTVASISMAAIVAELFVSTSQLPSPSMMRALRAVRVLRLLKLLKLDEYIAYRTQALNAKRAGVAVVSATAEHDKQCLLRFYGFLERGGAGN